MAEKNQVAVNFKQYLTDELTAIENALPKDFNKSRFVQNCVALANDNASIKTANPKDVVYGLLKGAYMGLDFFNKECYLIPYGGKLQFQTDYKGEVKFVKQYSTRPIKDIYAKVVRQGDEFEEFIVGGVPSINYNPLPFNDGDIVGAFSVCLFNDGGMIYETMSIKDIQAVRNNYSKAKNSDAWKNSLDEMCKKTVLRRLCKHIDKNIDSVEALKAYEEGSDITFNNQREVGDITKNPFAKSEEITEDNVIDVESEVITEEVVKTPDDLDPNELPFR